MKEASRWRFVTGMVCIGLLVGCEQSVVSPDPAAESPLLKWDCIDPENPYCLPDPGPGPNPDPDPSAPGYYIGSSFSMDACKSTLGGDLDGLLDACEQVIASRFAPLLATSPFDGDLSRETYWAATYRPPNWDGNNLNEHVEVIYLLGYHWDSGHSGDSEFIKHRIFFDNDSEHWQLFWSTLSAHWLETIPVIGTGGLPFIVTTTDFTEDAFWTWLEFPDKDQGYPLVWVSQNKHANYRSRSACNAGGVVHSDTCQFNVDDEQVSVSKFRNVGSRLKKKFVNGVTSANPNVYPGTEFFWAVGVDFCGWDLDRTDCAGGYDRALGLLGF